MVNVSVSREQIQFRALGSEIFVTLVGRADDFAAIFTEITQKITDFEARFSRFLPDSELSLFNVAAGEKNKISPEFREILLAAHGMARETDGIFNPFILPNLQQAGYKGSWPTPANFHEKLDFSERSITKIDELEIGKDFAKIPAGTALDFGGIGKGFLLDKLSDFLLTKNLAGFWLSLGGDIAMFGKDADGENWQVEVASADDDEKTVATVENADQKLLFVATSGITKRKGENWHHLIDPRTEKPADTDILTTTVTAKTGVAADIFAKSIVIAGKTFAKKVKKSGKINRAIIQYKNVTEEEI
jgi:thiamine biosynthesis lipoprotein